MLCATCVLYSQSIYFIYVFLTTPLSVTRNCHGLIYLKLSDRLFLVKQTRVWEMQVRYIQWYWNKYNHRVLWSILWFVIQDYTVGRSIRRHRVEIQQFLCPFVREDSWSFFFCQISAMTNALHFDVTNYYNHSEMLLQFPRIASGDNPRTSWNSGSAASSFIRGT